MGEKDRWSVLGSWMSGGWKVKLEARREGEGLVFILAEGLEYGERDEANPVPDLRARALLGIPVIEGLRWDGSAWTGGSIYDPESGRRYRCRVESEGPASLRVRGYLGLPFLGLTQRWVRPGSGPGNSPGLEEDYLRGLPGGDIRPWTTEKARAWMRSRAVPLGCDYIPAYACNQLEMWQPATFDPDAIRRELDLAAGLGFNALRVYLHEIPWAMDRNGYAGRIDRFLGIAAERGMSVLFVLFDDCWNDNPRPGRQKAPIPGVHNSRWVRCPGSRMVNDRRTWPRLEDYARGVIGAFGRDERILGWDLYNEVGNGPGFLSGTTALLAEAFRWAREADPSQPITCGIWRRSSWFEAINRFIIERSDVLSFHHYGAAEDLARTVDGLAAAGRPVLCTEYMARGQGSLFGTHLPILIGRGVGAFSWGLVDGKTQTKYPWGARRTKPPREPEPWFHEIFKADGTPYDEAEIALIRSLAPVSKPAT